MEKLPAASKNRQQWAEEHAKLKGTQRELLGEMGLSLQFSAVGLVEAPAVEVRHLPVLMSILVNPHTAHSTSQFTVIDSAHDHVSLAAAHRPSVPQPAQHRAARPAALNPLGGSLSSPHRHPWSPHAEAAAPPRLLRPARPPARCTRRPTPPTSPPQRCGELN